MTLRRAESADADKPIKVIATGGMANMIKGGVDCIDKVDGMLTLEGLQIIYEKNRREREKRKAAECKCFYA